LDAVTGHKLAHGGEPTRSEIRKIDGGGFEQMEAGSQFKLQRSKFNKNHCANGVLSEDVVKKMANLSDPLFNAEIKEAKTTQFFGPKGDASREMLIDAKFFQGSCDCLLLDMIEGRGIKGCNTAGIGHSGDVGAAVENEGIHLGK
jgi:hypothetical protein